MLIPQDLVNSSERGGLEIGVWNFWEKAVWEWGVVGIWGGDAVASGPLKSQIALVWAHLSLGELSRWPSVGQVAIKISSRAHYPRVELTSLAPLGVAGSGFDASFRGAPPARRPRAIFYAGITDCLTGLSVSEGRSVLPVRTASAGCARGLPPEINVCLPRLPAPR
jgi:hypothetical protein